LAAGRGGGKIAPDIDGREPIMQHVAQLDVSDGAGGACVSVKAVPGSSRDRIAGVLGAELKVAVAAAAEKGKANKAIAAVLAGALGVPARDVSLLAGPSSPRKRFRVAGMTAEGVRDALAAL